MITQPYKNRLCDTCRNSSICKYKEDVTREVGRISKDGTHHPLGIMFYCVHHIENKSERRTRGGDPLGDNSNIC